MPSREGRAPAIVKFFYRDIHTFFADKASSKKARFSLEFFQNPIKSTENTELSRVPKK